MGQGEPLQFKNPEQGKDQGIIFTFFNIAR